MKAKICDVLFKGCGQSSSNDGTSVVQEGGRPRHAIMNSPQMVAALVRAMSQHKRLGNDKVCSGNSSQPLAPQTGSACHLQIWWYPCTRQAAQLASGISSVLRSYNSTQPSTSPRRIQDGRSSCGWTSEDGCTVAEK